MQGRPRSNTSSFLGWRRPRIETVSQPSPVTAPSPTLSIDALVDALTPPAVPSLAHARSLAVSLASASPLPRVPALIPVLASLCHSNAPVAIQAAGYDVLSVFCEHLEALPLPTDQRLALFSLFLADSSCPLDLWEPRFKAFRAFTKFGRDVLGIEHDLIRVLQSWIAAVFDGLLKGDNDRLERERAIDILSKFLAEVLATPEPLARIPDNALASVLHFYGGLVDQSVLLLPKPRSPPEALPPKPSHRKNTSSLSSMTNVLQIKHPADIAITLYLHHLASQLKILSPDCLSDILPLLFRALAFCSSPLPRLSVQPHPARKQSSEDKITDTLNTLFSGPYSTRCMIILKTHLSPPTHTNSVYSALYTSHGAHRTFRNHVRRALIARIARAYISRESSVGYSPSGAPSHLNLERDLMERAWPSDDYTAGPLGLGCNGWDAGRLGRVLSLSVKAWVTWPIEAADDQNKARELKESILEEAAGVPCDIWQEMDSRGDDEKSGLDEEEACVVGETLQQLVEYVVPLKRVPFYVTYDFFSFLSRNSDGTPYILPLGPHTSKEPRSLLRKISTLLSRDHTNPTSPPLSTILIRISDNLTDVDTANLPRIMSEQQDLSPTSPDWLNNWSNLLCNSSFVNIGRPVTRKAVMEVLWIIYDSVRDMKAYRVPLADLVLQFCRISLEVGDREAGEVTWRILGDEVVSRTVECKEEHDNSVDGFIDILVAAAEEDDAHQSEEDDASSIITSETHHTPAYSPTPPATQPVSTLSSPNLSRTQSEHTSNEAERNSSIMSIITSLATGHSSRSQSHSAPPPATDEVPDGSRSLPQNIVPPRVVAAASALISIFGQLTFTPLAFQPSTITVAIRIYSILLRLVKDAKSPRARLTALQFLMHIRADRNHRLYFVSNNPSHVVMLSALIHRTFTDSPASTSIDNLSVERTDREPTSPSEARRPRPLVPLRERDERALSRGRTSGQKPSRNLTTSRSGSRVASTTVPRNPTLKPHPQLWHMPEIYPFEIPDLIQSEGLLSYDPDSTPGQPMLPISEYLTVLNDILENETNWDVLSYVLCHLPVQLANKHLFCGTKARAGISRMLTVICTGILNGDMATHLEDPSIKSRDAHCLAYHTLSVLVSFRRCFELKQCHLLVEAFLTGLSSGQFSTIKCCLHALALAAVELQSSMTKFLPRVLEMLSQIMSGANIAVHVLGFLFLIGAIPPLYTNFTENDYRMVFGVALQYLQHYNRLKTDDPNTSWALSQHVRILSYTVVYVWFLALQLLDRPKHIPYITRQLLLANEGNDELDDPTEVCFDWLARYTYASADPRPAPSVFNDIVMNPPGEKDTHTVLSEKTWVYGYTLITIRALSRRGWVEVLCRRPSGFTKFLCRVENVPLVGAGDVDPDLFSVPASLTMERVPAKVRSIVCEQEGNEDDSVDITGVSRGVMIK